jgi:2-phosphosulfolactate phosphatase
MANGMVVVIDVLRAFSSCCYIFDKGVKKIIPVANLSDALNLIKKNPEYISIGERKGIKIDGFNYGNSPKEISLANLNNKNVIFTTSAGTLGLTKVIHAEEILTGAFVNANAILRYIKMKKPETLSLVITDDKYSDNEDYMFAQYLIALVKGEKVNFEDTKEFITKHPTSIGFLTHPLTKYSVDDFHLCLCLDKFNFVVKAKKNSTGLVLEKYEI